MPETDFTEQRHSLRRFLAYVWPYGGLILRATGVGMLKFVLPSTMALALRFLTDRLVPAQATVAAPAPSDIIAASLDRYLTWLGHILGPFWATPEGTFHLLMLTLVLVYGVWAVTVYYRSQWAQLAGHRVIMDLRSDLYRHVQSLSHSFFQERQSGGIVSRLMADIALAQNFVGSAMSNIWVDLVTCAVYVYVLASMDGALTMAALAVFPFYIGSMRWFGARSKRASRAVQQAMEEFSGDVQERVAGFQLVKSFVAERREALSFFRRSRQLLDLALQNAHISNLSSSLVQWLTQMATLGLVWYGGRRLMLGTISVGTVVAFILLVRELYFPVNRISEINTVLHNSLAAIDRIFEVFDLAPSVQERSGALPVCDVRGRVTFENVSFGYQPPARVLHDLNIDIAPGEMVALVGSSGAGKSSLAQLVPRFYDPQLGRVLLDGTDLRELRLRELRAQIGIVAQENFLFSGSVLDNILYGRPRAGRDAVAAAARSAHAAEFIDRLPDGYDTLIGERGISLSGGQKQRLALARVFLADPRVLILDEATSSLDSESEQLIQHSLAELMRGRTSIVIAHRLSTILTAHRIVVLAQGRIVQVGSHAELTRVEGPYARLYEAQRFGRANDMKRELAALPVAAATARNRGSGESAPPSTLRHP
jgi:ABC-type multidrug transport system fused ATPase/permease subunit